MKKNILIYICISIITFAFLVSCENVNTSIPPLSITIDDTVYDGTATYDFGIAAAESTGITKTLILKNTGDAAITVTSITLSDDVNYAATTPTLPFTTAVNETAELGMSFIPQSSGSKGSKVSVSIEGISNPFVLSLTGEGNYAPTVKFGIEVIGAGTSAANGFYNRDGFHSGGDDIRPLYTKTGPENYYCYIYPFDGDIWAIDNTLTAGYPNPDPQYDLYDSSLMMVPPATGWGFETGIEPAPSITRYDITGTQADPGEVLTANYFYFDADNDPKASVSYQWYRSDTNNVDGSYAEIPGENSEVFTITDDDSGKYLKVEISPSASTGIIVGQAFMSSPTIKINNSP